MCVSHSHKHFDWSAWSDACEEETRKVSEEMEERKVRFATLSEKSGNCRMAVDALDDEIKVLLAGEERGSCASQSNGCCSDTAIVEQYMQNVTSKPCRKIEDSRLQPLPSTWQEEKTEKNGKNGKRNRRKRKEEQEGVTKALRWVLLWILLGTRM